MYKKVMLLMSVVVVLGLAVSAQATVLPISWPVQHHWNLEETEGTTAYDVVGGLNATNVGATIDQAGPGDPDFKAYEFGSEEGDVLQTGEAFIPPTGDWAAFVTFKTSFEHPSADQGHLFGWNDGVDAHRGALYIYKSKLGFWVKDGPGLAAGPSVDDGEWHTAGIQREGDDWTLWLDGDVAGTGSGSFSVPAINVVIGNGAEGYDYDFEGLISDVAYMPEPMTIALLGMGSLVLLRRRKK